MSRILIHFSLLIIFIGFLPTANAKPNVLLICVDDLRPELNCYGKDYIVSPNIDAIAARGRIFRRHFVQAPTCGASRYTLLTGRYGPASNNALFNRATQIEKNPKSVPTSMPAWFRDHGYTTVSVGKVSHHPGGRGGPDWDQDDKPEMPLSWDRHLLPAGPWQHPRGAMHGLAHGEIRKNAKDMDLFQAVDGADTIYPDGLITEEALKQMDQLTAKGEGPFFLAVGIIRPHLPFGAPAKYLAPYKEASLPPIPHPDKPTWKSTWHGSGEFMKYNRWKRNPNTDQEFATEVRRHYAACVTYADTLIGRLIQRLESSAAKDNTIIVIWGDHGWHLGEHAVWGKHTLFEESLHSPLIIAPPTIKHPGQSTEAIVESVDIFPTLCELAQLPQPDSLHGQSLLPHLRDPSTPGHAAYAYRSNNRTIRNDSHRLIAHGNGYNELYDQSAPDGGARNIGSENPMIIEELTQLLQKKDALRSKPNP